MASFDCGYGGHGCTVGCTSRCMTVRLGGAFGLSVGLAGFRTTGLGTHVSGFASSFVARPCVLKHTPCQKLSIVATQ